MVRALASQQCGPGSISGLGVVCGLSLLLVLVPIPRVFLRVLLFSSLHKTNISKFHKWNANAEVRRTSREAASGMPAAPPPKLYIRVHSRPQSLQRLRGSGGSGDENDSSADPRGQHRQLHSGMSRLFSGNWS